MVAAVGSGVIAVVVVAPLLLIVAAAAVRVLNVFVIVL